MVKHNASIIGVGTGIEFRILGPIEVRRRGVALNIGGPRQRALLAVLLFDANRVVSRDRLIDELLSGAPGGRGDRTLRVQVSRLRAAIDPDRGDDSRVIARAPGYLLRVEPGELDLHRFESLVSAGRGAIRDHQLERAARLLRTAESLWRGRPLADLEFESFARLEVERLRELELSAVEARIDAELALGRHPALVAELERRVAEDPFREHLRRQLMLALYRSGRQAEALEAYQIARAHLIGELGLEPGRDLQALQAAILNQDPSLSLGAGIADHLLRSPDVATVSAAQDLGAIPGRTAPLIGRERELDQLQILLCDPSVGLLTLTGTGGAGKSTLALESARRTSSAFADGVSVAWLASIEHVRQVVPELARVLGLELSAEEPGTATLIRALRDQQRLLVLDNFEHVIGAAPLVAQIVAACPQVTVLVTSRGPLRVSLERTYEVRGLAAPGSGHAPSADELRGHAATALFIARATAANPRFELTAADSESVSELCRYLGGLPLAVELAAARTAVLSPAEILTRLRTSSERLGPARRDAPPRHRTLQATVKWSLDLLNPAAQRLFARLGIFVGGCTIEAVEAVCHDHEPQLVDELTALHDHGLIHRASGRDGSRFGMLEPIRAIALERLRGDGEDELVVRYAEYYATLAESSEIALKHPGQSQCAQRLDEELPNLRSVLIRATSQPGLDIALRLAAALIDFWYIRDLLGEVRVWLAWALQQPPGDPVVRARACYTLGAAACVDGELDQASTALEDCLELCRDRRDISLLALCEAQLAWLRDSQGDTTQADASADSALRLASTISDTWTQATVMMLAGGSTRSYETARQRYQQALALFTARGDEIWPPQIKRNLGYFAVLAGDSSYARQILHQALSEMSSAHRGMSLTASIEGDLGILDLFEQRHSDAREHITKALTIWRRIGQRPGAREMLTALAALAAVEERGDEAWKLFEAAQAAYDGPLSQEEEILIDRYLPKRLNHPAESEPVDPHSPAPSNDR